MNFLSKLGTFSIVVWMNACAGHGGDDAGLGDDDRGEGYGDSDVGGFKGGGDTNAGGSQGNGDSNAGGSKSGGDTNAGGSQGDGDSHAGGSQGDGDSHAGGSQGDGDSHAGGSQGDGDSHAGGAKSDGDSHAGGAKSDGDRDTHGPESDGDSNASGAGGFNGDGDGDSDDNAGLGGVSSNGGSGGLSESGGSGSVATSAGSGGSAGNGSVSLDPEFLFTEEDFGGNGRTCITCHTAETGTISPSQIQTLYSVDPNGPLFRPIDSDDGVSDVYTRLRDRATFRVTVDLPPGVILTSDPSATSVVLRRGVPTTINSPALDPVIMWDGREPNLIAQAQSAILGHAEASVTPTATQLELIAQFEQGPDFFSSDLLRQYSQGGPAPSWPPGGTAEEQRGRRWFAPDPAAPRFNICGQCHGGPMTNETQANSGLPVGKHFQTANVSEFNTLGNPIYEFRFPDPNDPSRTVTVRTPDPGRALVTGNVRDLNFFKIPTLWGVKNTAPYFHDNSARTLEELMNHYERHLATFLFRNFNYPTPHVPTARDKADIIAYLKLL